MGGAFEKTLAVRKPGPEAKVLTDIYFFGTVVRLHRAGARAPWRGLKPAGAMHAEEWKLAPATRTTRRKTRKVPTLPHVLAWAEEPWQSAPRPR